MYIFKMKIGVEGLGRLLTAFGRTEFAKASVKKLELEKSRKMTSIFGKKRSSIDCCKSIIYFSPVFDKSCYTWLIKTRKLLNAEVISNLWETISKLIILEHEAKKVQRLPI